MGGVITVDTKPGVKWAAGLEIRQVAALLSGSCSLQLLKEQNFDAYSDKTSSLRQFLITYPVRLRKRSVRSRIYPAKY